MSVDNSPRLQKVVISTHFIDYNCPQPVFLFLGKQQSRGRHHLLSLSERPMCAPVSRLRPHCRGLPSAPQRRSAAAGGGAHFSLEGLFALSYPRPLQPLPRFLGSGLGKRQAFSDSNPSLRYVRTKISWSSGLYSFYTFSKIRVEFFIGINCF